MFRLRKKTTETRNPQRVTSHECTNVPVRQGTSLDRFVAPYKHSLGKISRRSPRLRSRPTSACNRARATEPVYTKYCSCSYSYCMLDTAHHNHFQRLFAEDIHVKEIQLLNYNPKGFSLSAQHSIDCIKL